MKILIIGGGRFMGLKVVKMLLARGHSVRVFNRGNYEFQFKGLARHIIGDRHDGFHFSEHFDAVVDMCAYRGLDTEVVLSELKFDYFLHVSTVAVYKKSEIFPVTEDFPIGPWPLWGNYNKGKVVCEKVLANSKVCCGIVRPVYILGANNYLPREIFIYDALKKNRPIKLPGNGEAIVQFVFVEDVARVIVKMIEKKITGAYNCCGDDVVTLKGLIQIMSKIIHKRPVFRFEPKCDGENFQPEHFPFANENFFCSNEKIKKIGASFIPLVDGLKKDYQYYYKKVLQNYESK